LGGIKKKKRLRSSGVGVGCFSTADRVRGKEGQQPENEYLVEIISAESHGEETRLRKNKAQKKEW